MGKVLKLKVCSMYSFRWNSSQFISYDGNSEFRLKNGRIP